MLTRKDQDKEVPGPGRREEGPGRKGVGPGRRGIHSGKWELKIIAVIKSLLPIRTATLILSANPCTVEINSEPLKYKPGCL